MLLAEHSKKQTLKIVSAIGASPDKFSELVNCMLGADEKLAQRAAWPLGFVIKKHPELLQPLYGKLLKRLYLGGHNAVRRNILVALENAPIPKNREAALIDACFDRLNDPSEFVAIKATAISILGKLVGKYPELRGELNTSIQMQWENASAGFRSRARKIVKSIGWV